MTLEYTISFNTENLLTKKNTNINFRHKYIYVIKKVYYVDISLPC